MLARRPSAPDEGWIAVALTVASIGALAATRQLGWVALAVTAVAATGGGAIGHWRDTRTWAPDLYVASLVALVVVFAALPDTEGASVLGAALVPVTVGALARRTWWHGAASGAAVAALATAVGIIAVDAAAGRTGALVVTALGALVSAGLVVVVVRLLVGRAVTSERERPSP